MSFTVGDTVVYPHHGAGRVIEVKEQDYRGVRKSFLVIQILHSDMTVMVPVESAERAGIRAVITESMVEDVIGVLHDDPTRMPLNWNRRLKHNREKISTGDILEIADVVRNLALRDAERGLSTGEKQMFCRAKRILASELMYAKCMREADAVGYLDGVLADVCRQAREQPCLPVALPEVVQACDGSKLPLAAGND